MLCLQKINDKGIINMQLFSDGKGNVHAVDLYGAKPIFTISYRAESSAHGAIYNAFQFYKHPKSRNLFLKVSVNRVNGELNHIAHGIVTRIELLKFITDFRNTVTQDDIHALVAHGVVVFQG